MQSDSLKPKSELKRRCYQFSLNIIKLADILPRGAASSVIYSQLLRSATSIGANIVEASASSSKRDFANFYTIALKSANETKYWLGLLRDGVKVDSGQMNNLLNEVEEISNILGASVLTMRNKR